MQLMSTHLGVYTMDSVVVRIIIIIVPWIIVVVIVNKIMIMY